MSKKQRRYSNPNVTTKDIRKGRVFFFSLYGVLYRGEILEDLNIPFTHVDILTIDGLYPRGCISTFMKDMSCPDDQGLHIRDWLYDYNDLVLFCTPRAAIRHHQKHLAGGK